MIYILDFLEWSLNVCRRKTSLNFTSNKQKHLYKQQSTNRRNTKAHSSFDISLLCVCHFLEKRFVDSFCFVAFPPKQKVRTKAKKKEIIFCRRFRWFFFARVFFHFIIFLAFVLLIFFCCCFFFCLFGIYSSFSFIFSAFPLVAAFDYANTVNALHCKWFALFRVCCWKKKIGKLMTQTVVWYRFFSDCCLVDERGHW